MTNETSEWISVVSVFLTLTAIVVAITVPTGINWWNQRENRRTRIQQWRMESLAEVFKHVFGLTTRGKKVRDGNEHVAAIGALNKARIAFTGTNAQRSLEKYLATQEISSLVDAFEAMANEVGVNPAGDPTKGIGIHIDMNRSAGIPEYLAKSLGIPRHGSEMILGENDEEGVGGYIWTILNTNVRPPEMVSFGKFKVWDTLQGVSVELVEIANEKPDKTTREIADGLESQIQTMILIDRTKIQS